MSWKDCADKLKEAKGKPKLKGKKGPGLYDRLSAIEAMLKEKK